MTSRRSIFLATLGAGVAVTAIVAAPAGAAGTPAAPGCGADDVHVAVAKSPDHATGHQAFTVHYTAANPAVHCTLAGAPTDAVFFTSAGDPAAGISAADEQGSVPKPVAVDATHSAVSYIVEPLTGQHNAVGAVAFMLPSGAQAKHVKVPWSGTPITGPHVEFSPLFAG